MPLLLGTSGTKYVAIVTKLLSSYCVAPLVEPLLQRIKHFCYKLAKDIFFHHKVR